MTHRIKVLNVVTKRRLWGGGPFRSGCGLPDGVANAPFPKDRLAHLPPTKALLHSAVSDVNFLPWGNGIEGVEAQRSARQRTGPLILNRYDSQQTLDAR